MAWPRERTAVRLRAEEVRRLDEQSPHADYHLNWFTARLRDPATEQALGTVSPKS